MSAQLNRIADSGEQLVEYWKDAGEDVQSAIDNMGTAMQKLGVSVKTTTTSAENAAESLADSLKSTADETSESIKDIGDSARKTGEDLGETADGAKKTSSAIDDLNKVLVAAGVTAVLTSIADAFKSAVIAAAEYESALAGVYKTVSGTSDQLRQIDEDIQAMSLVMPASAVEIARVAEAAGQLGIKTEDITAFTEVMIGLGEATNLSSDEAASALAQFANITGMSADNFSNLGSTVVALGNNFATTEADIVYMSQRLASAGTLAGLTEPQILALSASLSSVGIEAEAGGSAMSRLLSDMQIAVETGNESLKDFADVAGMTGQEFQTAFRDNGAEALYAFISGLNDVERNGADATVILENMGITEIRLSNAVKSLAMNSDGLASALSFANTAWEENSALSAETAVRYDTLESKMAMLRNSQQQLAVAIGKDLNPTIEKFTEIGTDFTQGLTKIVEKSPAVTAGLVGLTAAAAAFTLSASIATVATIPKLVAALGALKAAAIAALHNPVILATTAVVGLTAGIITLVSAMDKGESEFESWSGATQKQYTELQSLKGQYEDTASMYGVHSEKALELRYQVDSLSESFENNKKTSEQLYTELENIANKHSDINKTYADTTEQIKDEETSTLALIQQLEKLSSKTTLTANEQRLMGAIVDDLNTSIPGLALNFDKLTGSINMTGEELRNLATKEATENQFDAEYKRYVGYITELETLKKAEAEANAELGKEYESLSKATDKLNSGNWGWFGFIAYSNAFKKADEEYTKIEKAYDTAKSGLDEAEEFIKYFEETYAGAVEGATQATVDYTTAVNTAVGNVEEELKVLIEAYQEVYDEAYSNISATIGLFNEMDSETERLTDRSQELTDKQKEYSEAVKEYGANSREALDLKDEINDLLEPVQAMTDAWQSQVDWINNYTENIEKAQEVGLNEGLIASLSDGSEESAARLDDIINRVEELGNSGDVQKFVDDFNAKFLEVETAKQTFSQTVADMETDFTEKLAEIETSLKTTIDNMNMDDDAADAAKKTMEAYVDNILTYRGSAAEAATQVQSAVTAALNGVDYKALVADTTLPKEPDLYKPINYGGITPSSVFGTASLPQLPQYAGGIEYAPGGLALVGEEGPEIVQFRGGERVYPNNETNTILTAPPEITRTEHNSEKKITLNINGSGEITFDRNADKQAILDVMVNNIKPVLLDLINTEINEESEGLYAY
jgi:TP901 family phage tail tape measure protein